MLLINTIGSLRQYQLPRVVGLAPQGGPLHFVVHIVDELVAKSGQKTLAQLDLYRYTEAPNHFSLKKPSRLMQLQDVKSLVEWKL